MAIYTLKLWERADKANPLQVETFDGDLNGASRRLDEIWNSCPGAVMNGERYRAAAIEAGSRRHAIQIW